MADTKLSALSSVGSLADTDQLYLVKSGVSYKVTWGTLKAAVLLAKYPEVANFAALPAAASYSGETYVCLAAQGVYFVNRKPAGFYYSDGATWERVGALPEDYFTDSILQLSDDGDPSKIAKFELSGISTGTTRTFSLPDATGTVALVADVTSHTGNTSNPHSVTKSQVGLGNVDNTSNATERAATATLTNKTISAASNTLTNLPGEIQVACSDESTDLTTGTGKVTFRMPYAMTLTGVRASVTTAPTGAALQVDINEAGVSVLSTVLSIDATEKTSETAATAAVISDAALADDAEVTIDIDQIGSTIAGAGLKVTLIGTRT